MQCDSVNQPRGFFQQIQLDGRRLRVQPLLAGTRWGGCLYSRENGWNIFFCTSKETFTEIKPFQNELLFPYKCSIVVTHIFKSMMTNIIPFSSAVLLRPEGAFIASRILHSKKTIMLLSRIIVRGLSIHSQWLDDLTDIFWIVASCLHLQKLMAHFKCESVWGCVPLLPTLLMGLRPGKRLCWSSGIGQEEKGVVQIGRRMFYVRSKYALLYTSTKSTSNAFFFFNIHSNEPVQDTLAAWGGARAWHKRTAPEDAAQAHQSWAEGTQADSGNGARCLLAAPGRTRKAAALHQHRKTRYKITALLLL